MPQVGLNIFLRDPNTTKLPHRCKAVDPGSTKRQAAVDEIKYIFPFFCGFLHTLPLLSFSLSDAEMIAVVILDS